MTYFFTICQKSGSSGVPSDAGIEQAMKALGCQTVTVEPWQDGKKKGKKVSYDKILVHSKIVSQLSEIAVGKGNWDIQWGDAQAVDAGLPRYLYLASPDATEYTVTINLDDDTVNALTDNGYHLCGFKAVQSQAAAGKPLVWFTTEKFQNRIDIRWQVNYTAYISTTTDPDNNTQIVASSQTAIALGQTWELPGSKIVGDPGMIGIHNTTQTPYTCGLAQAGDASTAPALICAFPLYGGGLDAIIPIEKVLLTFATKPVNTGTVFEQSFTPSILIDLTAASANTRTVSYDMNKNWSWGDNSLATWGQQLPAKTDLTDLLITQS
ncbi:hypothetical protein ABZ746_34230 [Streptomyces sp. NPDC020096]